MVSSMEFNCKLAHRNEVKRVSRFNSIKELYERVSQTFETPIQEILFCTLNTHNFSDMDALLGNHLSLKDLIVVHLCGEKRSLNLTKNEDYLGLTITDNGYGKAFVKKVKSEDGSIEKLIKAGDHIAAINAESTVGMRHYEVAKAIRDIPKKTNFRIVLVEPLQAKRANYNNGNDSATSITSEADRGLDTPTSRSSSRLSSGKHSVIDSLTDENASYLDDLVNSSLPIGKLLSKSQRQLNDSELISKDLMPQTAASGEDSYEAIIFRINRILESFLGINDNVLAVRIYRLAKESKNSFDSFSNSIKTSELKAFSFGDEIEAHLWDCVVEHSKD